ncbi:MULTISPECIES: metallophosphoesterase [Halobacterium]|uniref:Metallophosphoesterase domain protein n=1 Tax=Halobacterium salinarum (strain ATCC 33171 / DSM 3754 / JCM 8978 / NBRC 102687 / NCIMB 764 / 91-R6) TaxID=2597657 RepID=A0A4D6H062_HALS9|nr:MULTISPECIES: metallophosphoesterase [Halobacterium]MCF2165478.1 hypothetical protein [Halobacterium salinarum]MCF2168175.1 hypothetical protein [Halobacterium salinarum]MCF2208160.1 hypothetical protein [Halobacterium salinarum]MCF2240393.1 hypothetical protein [Halobacterium salinarum]MDL0123441.1 hypothetical protein [Halobacterium salinarum]
MSVYLISDTHFNDPDILDKSPRNFEDISEMNRTLIRNWTNTVDESDSVLFGGDLAHSDIDKQGFYHWAYKVNNIEIILRGNHDPYNRSELDDATLPLMESYEFSHRGFNFYCSHKYSGIPEEFDGWHIHGHNHHKRPFLEMDTKRINISADVLGYKPVSLEELIDAIENGDDIQERSQPIL